MLFSTASIDALTADHDILEERDRMAVTTVRYKAILAALKLAHNKELLLVQSNAGL